MGKNNKKPIPPNMNKKLETPNPQKILSQAQQIKDKFAMQKGRADQLVADSMSDTINGMLNIIQELLGTIQQLEQQNKIIPKKEEPEKP
jgi:hypothetical protein